MKIIILVHLLITLAELLRLAANPAQRARPVVERLIGTNRREYLDRIQFWNAVDLARKREALRDY